MSWILLLILLVIFLAVMPRWSYSRSWGWTPGGIVGFLLVVLLILWLLGYV